MGESKMSINKLKKLLEDNGVRCHKCKYYDGKGYFCTNKDAFNIGGNLRNIDGDTVNIKRDISADDITIPFNFGCIHFVGF